MNKIFKVLCGCLVGCSFGTALTSCSDEFEPTYLDQVRVSSSYVAIPQAGGSATITVNTAADWALASQQWIQGKDTITAVAPEWLSVSATQGAAGTAELTVSAEATDAARECELLLTCAGKTQRINVLQYAEDTEPTLLTVQEALSLLKAGTAGDAAYYVKGIVCKVQEISPSYGNATYFLSDDGSFGADNWLEVYRGKWLNGASFTKGNEFSVGDELVVKGVLTMYGDTPETKQGTCEVISYSPSLIKVDSLSSTDALPVEGGLLTAFITTKGDGVHVEIPEDAQDWLYISAVNGTNITFRVLPNAGDKRSTTVTFKTVADGKEYTTQAAITQKGVAFPAAGSGTEEDPFNVTAAINACEAGMTGAYVKGIVSKAPESVNTKYGSCTYYISADGKETSDQLQVYSGLFLDKEQFTSADQVKVGDVVIVVGDLKLYNGTAEIDKNNWLYSLNGNKGANAALPTSLDVDFKTNGQGDWAIKEATALPEGLSFVWNYDSKYGMKATSFVNKVRYVVDSWLISPAVKLDAEATLTIEQALNYGDNSTVHVMMSTSYDGGAINPADWTELTLDQWPEGNNWNFLTSTAKVPAAAKVFIAFRYTSTESVATTWEIKTLSLK